jgi:predicted lipoprotein with Yx(FWY)xxD motif
VALMKRSVKRSVVVAGALVALSACAPAGYQESSPGAAEPVAVAAAEPSVAATPEPSRSPAADAPERDVDLTEELIGKRVAKMGRVVTDEDGWVLYRFDKDTADPPTSNCSGICAQVWPPVLTDGEPALTGIAEDRIGTITRQDGTRQVTLGGWPLYRYVGDRKPGQWKGQGVSGTWFVVAPDGKKNLSCLPVGTPKPVAPPADSGGTDSSY